MSFPSLFGVSSSVVINMPTERVLGLLDTCTITATTTPTDDDSLTICCRSQIEYLDKVGRVNARLSCRQISGDE